MISTIGQAMVADGKLRAALRRIQELATDTPFSYDDDTDALLNQIVKECEDALS